MTKKRRKDILMLDQKIKKINQTGSFSEIRKIYKKIALTAFAVAFVLAFAPRLYALEEINLNVLSDVPVLPNGGVSLSRDEPLLVTPVTPVTPVVSKDEGTIDYIPLLGEIYKSSVLELEGTKEEQNSAAKKIYLLLKEGKDKEAAKTIGTLLGVKKKNSLLYMGRYCQNFLPLAGDSTDLQIKYLEGFVAGYAKTGVVVLSKEGVASFSVYGKKRGTKWKEADSKTSQDNSGGVFYTAKNSVFIPFRAGHVLKIDIISAKSGTVNMWKILNDGINSKAWECGQWEREVTVRGDKLF